LAPTDAPTRAPTPHPTRAPTQAPTFEPTSGHSSYSYDYDELATESPTFTLPDCEDEGPVPGAYNGPCVHDYSSGGGVKVMFRTADGQIQELGDLQLPEGKRIMYQDSQGDLQELPAAAVTGIGGDSPSAAAAPTGGLSRTALALFLTSPLLVVGALAVVVLGAVAMAQRRLRRSAMMYEPISSNQQPQTADFFDSEASYHHAEHLLL